MRHKHCIEIGASPVSQPCGFLVTEVHYGKGGANYLSGTHDKRGYSVRISIEDRLPSGATRFHLFQAGSKMWIEDAKAFSAKRLAQIADEIKSGECQRGIDLRNMVEARKAQVLEKAKLRIVPEMIPDQEYVEA